MIMFRKFMGLLIIKSRPISIEELSLEHLKGPYLLIS